MRIKSSDIPQADRLERVVEATVAVANGARTDVEISGVIGDSRDGRYYRRAAQNLGFITNEHNYAQVTEKGQELAENPSIENPLLIHSVLEQNIFQILIPFLEIHRSGVSRYELLDYIRPLLRGELADSTLGRRLSSMRKWLESLRIIETREDRIKLNDAFVPHLPVFNVIDNDQPLLPSTGDLSEYEIVEERMRKAKGVIKFYRNLARLERANTAHIRLVNLVASRIQRAGGIAKSNTLIDLASKMQQDFIFEMKSTTRSNFHSQVRKGLSQLYEYRYLENKPDARLVLVLENSIEPRNRWLNNYLENDRDIFVIWDGDNRLFGSPRAVTAMPFLNLNS